VKEFAEREKVHIKVTGRCEERERRIPQKEEKEKGVGNHKTVERGDCKEGLPESKETGGSG